MSSSQRRRRSATGTHVRTPRSPLRLIALACVGLTLMGAAYQTAFAGSNGGGGGNGGGNRPRYDRDEGDDDILPIVGGSAGAALLAALFARGVYPLMPPAFPIGGPHDCKERFDTLPQGETDLGEIRLVPRMSYLQMGWCRCLHFEVKNRKNDKWYSITHRPETIIEEIDDVKTPLVKMDGYKNIFCYPLTSPQSSTGMLCTVEGIFVLPGRAPMRATATIELRGPDEDGLYRTNPRGPNEGNIDPQ